MVVTDTGRIRIRTAAAEVMKGFGFGGVDLDAVHEHCSGSSFHWQWEKLISDLFFCKQISSKSMAVS